MPAALRRPQAALWKTVPPYLFAACALASWREIEQHQFKTSDPLIWGIRNMQGTFDVGLDVGSVSVNLVIMNPAGRGGQRSLPPPPGGALRTALDLLESLEFPLAQCRLVACTGMGASAWRRFGRPVDQVKCTPKGEGRAVLRPARAVVDMGGEGRDDHGGGGRRPPDYRGFRDEHQLRRRDGQLPGPAGQPAGPGYRKRFGELALRSADPPRVAGRCSVFAKSDMIHLQQWATPVCDIVAGLCVGLAPEPQEQYRQGQELRPAHRLSRRRGPQPGGAPGLPAGLRPGRGRAHHSAALLRPGGRGRGAGGPGKPAG